MERNLKLLPVALMEDTEREFHCTLRTSRHKRARIRTSSSVSFQIFNRKNRHYVKKIQYKLEHFQKTRATVMRL